MLDAQVLAQLIADIAVGVRVLRDRDRVPLTDDQIWERARNIAAGLDWHFDITLRPAAVPPDFNDGAIS